MSIVNNAMTHAGVHHDHEVAAEHNHDGDPSNEFEAMSHASHDATSTEDEECCDEETGLFYASLVNYDTPEFDLDYDLIPMTGYLINELITFFNHKQTNPYRLKSTLSPPSGAFARILFQSFLC